MSVSAPWTRPYIVAAGLAILGQAGDCLTTRLALARGAQEENPLMAWLMTQHWDLACCLKIALPLVMLGLCQKIFGSRPIGTLPVFVFAALGVIPACWNLHSIWYG